jgi:acyl-CoA synthetase (AMP-forming)/AMP-acid ligase II
MTLTERATVRALIERSDNHPALVVPESGTIVSYATLQRALDRAAGGLARLGLAEGDHVAILAAGGPAMITAFLAPGALGAAAAPLNPALGPAELAGELDDLRVSRLLHEGGTTAVAAAAASGIPASVIGFDDGLLHIDGRAGDPLVDTDDPDALALLLHTSGTTSKPKTVPIRQRNLVASTTAIARTYELNSDDVTMCVMPLFHVHGLVAAVLATLSTGGTVIVPRFRPSAFWADVAQHGDHPRGVAAARPRAPGATRASAPLRPVVLGALANGALAAVRGHRRRPAGGGLRHDRSRPPDGIEPTPSGRAPAGHGRAGNGRGADRPRPGLAAGGTGRAG